MQYKVFICTLYMVELLPLLLLLHQQQQQQTIYRSLLYRGTTHRFKRGISRDTKLKRNARKRPRHTKIYMDFYLCVDFIIYLYIRQQIAVECDLVNVIYKQKKVEAEGEETK